MKIVLSGGGTAGHVHPALAIAEALIATEEKSEITFIGRRQGKENAPMKAVATSLYEIEIYGIKRSLSPRNIKSIFCAIKSRTEAKKILKKAKPDVVLGTGGYVCWPVLSAAVSLGIPTLIHESNASAGLATRAIYKKCDKVLLNYSETEKQLPGAKEIITVGNPLRREFYSANRKCARQRLGLSERDVFILSFGGSLGAEAINGAATELLLNYSAKKTGIRHIHATGRTNYSEKLYGEYKHERNGCRILPYIDNMPTLLHAADIVICRAGAVTLSEISAVGCASILIPSPNVTDNHQYKNAKIVSDSGGAVIIEEKDLTYDSLLREVKLLCDNPERRKKLSKCIEKFAKHDSADRIIKIIKESIK
jgi:UDP-N-acetylglucosamine--N-acetylmuramyl-(pentapeptide) pyrophosphoryl-undecaprenol N-acetylglucosamine transferase